MSRNLLTTVSSEFKSTQSKSMLEWSGMTTVVTVKKEVEKIKERIVPKRREPIIINFWGRA